MKKEDGGQAGYASNVWGGRGEVGLPKTMPSTLLGGGAERGATGEAVDRGRLLPTLSPAHGCCKTPPTGAPARSRAAGPRRAPSATSATIVDHTHRAECPQRGFRGRRRPRGGAASERAALGHARMPRVSRCASHPAMLRSRPHGRQVGKPVAACRFTRGPHRRHRRPACRRHDRTP